MSRPIWHRLLGPLAPSEHLGLYLDEGRVHACAVVPTIVGPRVAERIAVPFSGGRARGATDEAVRQRRARAGRIARVVVGVPARDVYFETRRPMPAGPSARLHGLELVRSLGPRETAPPVVQVVQRPDRRSGGSLHTVIACRDSVLARLESDVTHDANSPVVLEPATLAALRTSLFECPPRDTAAAAVRVLLGPSFCAGYLLEGTRPLVIAVAPQAGDTERHVRALVAALVHHARAYLELEVEHVSVQGADPLRMPAPGQGIDARIELLAGPPMDGMSIAAGLALGSCGIPPVPVHLHRHHRERRRASPAAFPWRDVAAGAAGVAVIAFAMQVEAKRLRAAIARTQADHAEDASTSGKSTAELEAERARLLLSRDRLVELDDRPVSWSRALASLAQALPDQVRLSRIAGENPGLSRLPGQGAKAFTLTVVSPEKHQTLGAILADPYLKRAFPQVEVAMSVAPDAKAGLQYTIVAAGTGAVADDDEREALMPPGPP